MRLAIYNETNYLLDLKAGVSEANGAAFSPVLTGSDGLIDPSLLAAAGSGILIQRSVSSTYVANSNDRAIYADATAAGFSITLPDAATVDGITYTVKKTDATAHVVSIITTGGQTIDGAGNYPLSAQNQYVSMVAHSGQWQVISASAKSGGYQQAFTAVTCATNTIMDFSVSLSLSVLLNQDTTIEFINAPSGPELIIALIQDGNGNRMAGWASDITGVDPITGSANTAAVLKFVYVSGRYLLSNTPVTGQ